MTFEERWSREEKKKHKLRNEKSWVNADSSKWKKKNHYTNSFLDSFHLLERGFWTFTERFTHFFF